MQASLFHGPDDTVSRLEFLFHEPFQIIERGQRLISSGVIHSF